MNPSEFPGFWGLPKLTGVLESSWGDQQSLSPLGIPLGSAKDQESASIPILSLFRLYAPGKVDFSLILIPNILINTLGHSGHFLRSQIDSCWGSRRAGNIQGAGILEYRRIFWILGRKNWPHFCWWPCGIPKVSRVIRAVIPTWIVWEWERHPWGCGYPKKKKKWD